MKKQALATQFRRAFILILVVSAVATVLTYTLAAYLFTKSINKDIYPANYYEQQIPGIEAYVHEKNIKLLSKSEETGLRDKIHGEGMLYQVVDDNGNILYGTNPQKAFKTKEELFGDFLGVTVRRQGHRIYTVPITDSMGKIKGAVLLSYHIKATAANVMGKIVFAVMAIALFSPFLYIIGFTMLFSKKFAKNINWPLQLLIDASKKIQAKDLDFEIDYHSNNELGRLCDAFSEMKGELKKSLSDQWKMEQERTEIVEALAHDLKAPISVISGYTDALLENDADEKKLRRYLMVIKENVEKSAARIQQMQDTSDLEQADIHLQLISIRLPEFLMQKVRDYELQARQKQIEITLKIQDDMPCPVLIDIDRLTRILDNLICNSLQYTSTGGRIEITVKAEKERISYEIRDSGSGFSSKDLKKGFDKFYRGDEARQTKGGHSGLGLYIVRQLVEQMGGAVQIENQENGGASVLFCHKVFKKDE